MENFAKIVHDYSPRLIGLAQGIVGDRATAEDVVQDALVKAFQKHSSWRGEGRLSTWLYTIVYRQAISQVRSRKPIFKELREDIPETAEAENFETTEQNIVRMKDALSHLAPDERALVELFYIDDKSVRECAEICRLSEANVKVKLHRVRGKLRQMMN